MATEKQTSVFGNSLIWFGAAVSLAEIMTGALFAPLGIWKATETILIGHLLGCILLYGAGLIGAKEKQCAMECTKLTFGDKGGRLFSLFNLIQLVGWTAVMVASGAQAANQLYPLGYTAWAVIITLLILVWLLANFGLLQKINLLSVLLLFILSLKLSRIIFQSPAATVSGSLTYGQALELSIAMPVSWLPLIADYTSNASRPRLTCAVSAIVYFFVSCWMYLIGACAAYYTGHTDIIHLLIQSGLGIGALVIVILSTVTTTYLDVYSAGLSATGLHKRLPSKLLAVLSAIAGLILVLICPTSSFESFLYWVSSLFVPMATIQLIDRLLVPVQLRPSHICNLALWLFGVILYRIILAWNPPIGCTLPSILLTAPAYFFVAKINQLRHKSRQNQDK